jgi:hypothetical protein
MHGTYNVKSRRFLHANLFFGCKTWFMDLSEENRWEVFREQGVGENIWPAEGGSDSRMEETA